ncbi:MAG: hypothetical protein WB384_21865, partial [Candidatus Sulfotelmatobacter sp.]
MLPDELSWVEEYRLIGAIDPNDGKQCILYNTEIHFKRIIISANRTLGKVTGFPSALTLHISWDDAISRTKARSDFLGYLQ